ncbi:MAG TPA: hypothetical protein VFH78_14665, partial [Candidatus Thermoplasmatota archaeon]|nr:hypothetical protein [Candidatus Thermoplasmatota archaeon]
MAWRLAAAALTVALVAVLTLPAGAQEGATLPPGPIYLTEGIEVKAGETLRIGPGTTLTGPGNITVWGTLLVNGSNGRAPEFSVQIRVLGDGYAELRHARVWGVNATALEVFGGGMTLHDVLVEGNTRAALVKGSGRLVATDTVFRDHAGEAIYVEERAHVRLDRATLSGNGRGATVYSASLFHANDSSFASNGQHLVVDLGPWSQAQADILLARNRFSAPASTPAQLPSIVLRHDPPFVDAGEERTVRLASNTVQGAPVGLRIEGRGLVVESANDSYLDNDVGISIQQSTVTLTGPTFGNVRDVEGSGRLSVNDATYLRGSSPTLAPEAPPSPWPRWTLWGGGLVVLAALALLVPRLARRAPPPPPARPARAPPAPPPVRAPVMDAVAPEAPDAAPPPPAPPAQPDLATAISAVERRILEDILAHPGTA